MPPGSGQTVGVFQMLTRRLVLKTGLQAGVAALAMPAIGRAQSPGGAITLMSYNDGTFQDNYIKTVVEPFQQAFPGVQVNYAPSGTSAEMLGNIRAQKADPQIGRASCRERVYGLV